MIAEFNNERIVKECDIIFLCVLPSQASEMFKEIRPAAMDRLYQSNKHKHMSKPLFVSTLAATGFNKLKLMLNNESIFLKTKVNVNTVRDYLTQTANDSPKKAFHPVQMMGRPQSNEDDDDQSAQDQNAHMGSSRASNRSKAGGDPLKKVLSQKAIKIGAESGITAEFIVHQTSEQLVTNLEDLFLMFDIFQESLYSNDPHIQANSDRNATAAKKVASSRHSAASSKQPSVHLEENSKVMYEESILMTLLGPDYG